jgi:tRNA pseudouridine32 synthase/23S rRNA pseudouridine746 synthase
MPASEFHIDITQSECLAPNLLAEASGLSIGQVKQAMQKGAVWLDDGKSIRRLRRAKKALAVGSVLHFYFNPEVLDADIPAPTLLADEGDYSIWIKPRAVLSQGSKWGDHCTITRWVEVNDEKQRPAFLIHRLDRAATGLMLIGHSKKATQALTSMFAKKEIQKFYQAIVIGQFEDTDEPIIYNSEIDDRSAVSHAKLIQYDEASNQSLVEVRIETGRKHQVRKHLSEAGYPILGDRLYGGGNEVDLQLAAVSLTFHCPLRGWLKEYELPEDLRPSHCAPEPQSIA